MTLENIFFGKRVVKQAYLNNALIYQAKGWETLPSTYQEQWIKNYENVSSFRSISKDEGNNIYIGTSNMLYKIGPDGDFKWKSKVNTSTITNCSVTGIVTLSNCIYCSFYEMQSDVVGYISKFDKNGNLMSSKTISSFLPVTANNYFIDMKNDNNNIYAITTDRIFKLDFDLKLIDYTSVPNTASCIAINSDPYVFVGNSNYGIRFSKNNLKNNTNLIVNVVYSVPSTSITLDSIGHVYLGSSSNNSIYKFDTEKCQLLEARYLGINNGRVYGLYPDTQDNLYVIYNNGTNYFLRKYSSDGTLIWDNLPIPTKFVYIKIITDSNNNIYVCYLDSSYNLTIKKCINLVKKGR